ncbi:MAG TPA: hypothetical protein VGT02_14725 [Methylomirabilota bacterium]|jgi:hypothetical protein|nr:hypothetical protein [Methylomirabilota bacterium]
MANPWKVTAIGMAVVMATALVTGLVVANWTGGEKAAQEQKAPEQKMQAQRPAAPTRVASAPAAPSQNAIDACNKYATSEAGTQNKTMEVVKDGAVGALVGAAVGAAGGAIAGGGKGAGKGAAIGGVVGAGGGTLYGLNENKKHDERYRAAYASCMRARGYTS